MRAVAPTCVCHLCPSPSPLSLRSNRRMAVSPCPWSSVEEWDNVFDLLFSSDTDSQRKGISRVSAWKARGCVPALLEVTVDLVSCVVHEVECARDVAGFSGHVLQLMYAMALTRFVNGVFDVSYVTSSAPIRDIKTVLGHFGVPSYIVCLRHDCAHRTLPSLESLKCAADWGLQWLLRNYWEPQRLLNQETVDGDPTQGETEKSAQMKGKPRKRRRRTASGAELSKLLSNCSVTELSQHLISRHILNIPDSKVCLPEDPDKPVLPTGQFEGEVWSQWINSVRRRSEARPGLETLVVCAFITAMHDPSCAIGRTHVLAACLGQMLMQTSPGLNTVNWGDAYFNVLDTPGIYSEALMNIILQRVSGDVPAGVAAHSQQLARLIAHSERHSVSSYNRPLTAATQEELRTEVTSKAILTRQENRDRSSPVLEEAPPSKQPRLSDVSSSSKWILVTGDAPLEP